MFFCFSPYHAVGKGNQGAKKKHVCMTAYCVVRTHYCLIWYLYESNFKFPLSFPKSNLSSPPPLPRGSHQQAPTKIRLKLFPPCLGLPSARHVVEMLNRTKMLCGISSWQWHQCFSWWLFTWYNKIIIATLSKEKTKKKDVGTFVIVAKC